MLRKKQNGGKRKYDTSEDIKEKNKNLQMHLHSWFLSAKISSLSEFI